MKTPLMYKGWIIKNTKFGFVGYNPSKEVELIPVNTWEDLKELIDAMKE